MTTTYYRNPTPPPHPGHIDVVQSVVEWGCWTLAMAAPRLRGVARLSDWAIGIQVGDQFVARLVVDGGRPELLSDLVLRVARQFGTSQPYTLIYHPEPRTR